MKVMHVEAGLKMYGGARQVQYLIEGLNADHSITNILICDEQAEIVNACKDHCIIEKTSIKGDLDIGFIFRLKKIIKKHQPDIIHLHSRRGADVMGGLAARLTNTPCVLSRRVDNPESKTITRIKYSLYDSVVTISQGIANVLLSQGLNPTKINVIPSAVDIESYNINYDRTKLCKLFNLDNEHFIVGVIAQLIPRKGHQYLIEAAKNLIRTNPQLRFVFFGKGAHENSLKQLIEDKQLTPYFIFAGFRDDLQELIGALDLVVHPALMEGLGVSLLQAAAAKVPIIATNVGGIPEIIIPNKTGELIKAGSSEEVTKAISRLLENPELRNNYSEACYQHITNVFSLNNMVLMNLENYRKILGDTD